MSNGNVDFVDKIEKLLRKVNAEGATEAEAEAAFQMAQRLMVKYAVSEQEIAERQGIVKDEIIQDSFDFTGIYKDALFFIGSAVARVNDLKALVEKIPAAKWRDQPAATRIYLIGFSKDVAQVKALIASLTTQALVEQARWWRTEGKELHSYLSGMQQFKARRTFIDGFRVRVSERLAEAKKAAVQEIVEERTTEDTSADAASQSVALVLTSRKEQVNAWYDEKYAGRTRTSRMGGYDSGGGTARGAGSAAGSRADIGLGKLGGNRGQIGS